MSFGALPASGSTSSSLLFPPNRAYNPVDSSNNGGILINVHEASEPTIRTPSPYDDIGGSKSSDIDSPVTPVSQLYPDHLPSILSPSASSAATSTPRIRFAPLPDPRRPRSASTGENLGWKSDMEADGERTRAIAIRGVEPAEYDDDEDGEEGDADGKRGRRWSKSMGMAGSWKGAKKLLGVSVAKEEAGYSEGAPLKKSVSTGGFIGASPFRWASEQERKRTMQGLPPPRTDGHRRNSSMEASPTRLSSSPGQAAPVKVKLLNGRVYGSRRASEAAERARIQREQDEPKFVEWGHGKSGGGMGSVAAPATSGRSLLGDEEDGSGMEWVKRRREEREKKRRESESIGQGGASQPVAPQTPVIQVSEYPSPNVWQTKPRDMPDRGKPDEVFEEEGPSDQEDEEDEEEESDSDTDDEEEAEAVRTTSSAAGVEVISRHK